MMKPLSKALALIVLGTATASAADLPRRTAAPYSDPVYAPSSALSWTGLYAGVNLGYASGTYRDSVYYRNATGALLGATGGYNFQSGNLVIGAEGDLSYAWISEKNSFGGGLASKIHSPTFVTLRGRVGYAMDRIMFYGTAGYAGLTSNAALNDPTLAYFTKSQLHSGYVIGAGLEYAFTQNISAKMEFLYATTATGSAFSGRDATSIGIHENIVRTGVNYHF